MSTDNRLYSDLSHYYDRFCADIDYAQQAAFAERAFRCFAASGGYRHLDLACGTGQLMGHMRDAGFLVSGLDYSADMLREAAGRCPNALLIEADMAELTLPEPVDLITCFLYSLHYSHPVSRLQTTLGRMYEALKPGGMVLFDVVDKRGIGCRDIRSTYAEPDGSMLTFCSGWRYAGVGEQLDLHLSIERRDSEHQQCWQDRHTMTALTITELEQWMHDAGFEVTLLAHDYSALKPLDKSDFNAIVVGVRP